MNNNPNFNIIQLSQQIAHNPLINIDFDIDSIKYLDLSGLKCPLPILKTKQQLNSMNANEIIMIVATDPHAEIDFKAYLVRATHQLLYFGIHEERYVFCIKKSK